MVTISNYKKITITLPELPESVIREMNDIEDGIGVYNKSCFINRCRVSKHPELQFPRIDTEEIDRKLSAIEEKNNNLDSNKPKQKIKGLEKK